PRLVIPIAEHDGISSRAQLTGLPPWHDSTVSVDNLDLEVRLYPSDRGDAQFERIVPTTLEAHGTGFGHPIGDGYLTHVHCRSHFLHDLDRARRPRHDASPKRAQIEARELGMVQLGNEHRGHPVE